MLITTTQEKKQRKPRKGLFQRGDGSPQPNYATRVPSYLTPRFIRAIQKRLQPLVDSGITDEQDLFNALRKPSKAPATLPLNAILITEEDLTNINNRALGWLACKLNLQEKPTEIKGSDRDQVLNDIKSRLHT